jgi:hypothetical protein
MSTGFSGNHVYMEKLLALAVQLWKQAGSTRDSYQGDKMRRTAEGLEKAGARAITILPKENGATAQVKL